MMRLATRGSIVTPARFVARSSPGHTGDTPGRALSFSDRSAAIGFDPYDRDPIRVGVIGTGFGASLHLSALRENPDFEAAAICSRP